MILATDDSDVLAPCSVPCSFGSTLAVISAWMFEPASPHSAPTGRKATKTHDTGAKA